MTDGITLYIELLSLYKQTWSVGRYIYLPLSSWTLSAGRTYPPLSSSDGVCSQIPWLRPGGVRRKTQFKSRCQAFYLYERWNTVAGLLLAHVIYNSSDMMDVYAVDLNASSSISAPLSSLSFWVTMLVVIWSDLHIAVGLSLSDHLILVSGFIC